MNVRGGSIILYTPKVPKNYSLLVCVWKKLKNQLILLFSCFFYYLWAPLHFLVLFMDPTVLFQLTFTFIYSTFNKKFLSFNKISESQIDP